MPGQAARHTENIPPSLPGAPVLLIIENLAGTTPGNVKSGLPGLASDHAWQQHHDAARSGLPPGVDVRRRRSCCGTTSTLGLIPLRLRFTEQSYARLQSNRALST